MLAATLCRGGEAQQVVLRETVPDNHIRQAWLSLGERAGFIEDDGGQAARHSSASPPLTRMPRPVPTMMEVGVARPMAHGQAMMSTATKFMSANVNAGSGPKRNQIMKTSVASTMTAGTKTLLILSARRCIGAFDPCASSTIRMIPASAVSPPTLVAENRNVPVLLTVAPMTSSPARFTTGMGSLEIMASSTADSP